MTYDFTVTLENNEKRTYTATSYQALYEYLYNDRRRDFEMYDILKIEIIRKYIYRAISDGKLYLAEIPDEKYSRLEYEYKTIFYQKFASIDAYIKYVLAYNN